ncbi:MAG TPA: hypothetical protein VIY10_22900 [Solirubrobacteraceae bacterium]
MHSIGRPRQYVSPARLYAMYPFLRFSYERGAYILRVIGETKGPVLRKDRRRSQGAFRGTERRAGAVDPQLASRPAGNVRRIEPDEIVRGGAGRTARTEPPTAAQKPVPPARVPNTKRSRAAQAQATRRRRQGGRPQPPHPHR